MWEKSGALIKQGIRMVWWGRNGKRVVVSRVA